MQNKSVPKKRIGRARFFLEFIFAAVLLKVSASAAGVIALVIGSIGLILAIWASIKRLRDIKRSEWWAVLLIAPIPLGFVYGFTGISGADGAKIVGVVYLIIYLVYIGVLLFWPSAFPKETVEIVTADKGLSATTEIRESKVTMAPSASDIEDRAFAQAASELDTTQRDDGVWARAYSDAEGNESRARALYIRYRVERIRK